MENDLKEKFMKTKDPYEEKYRPFCELEFDYEINNHFKTSRLKEDNQNYSDLSINGFSDNFSEKDSQCDNSGLYKNLQIIDDANFNDELAPRYYNCEDVPCYKKNYFKAIVSNKRIRLINRDFDLDLM